MPPAEHDATGRPNYDQALKRLLLRAHDAFLDLIAPGLTWRGELSPELPGKIRQADLVWEVEIGGRSGLLHVELQIKVEKDIGERVAEYALSVWRREHLPVESVVVFLRPVANTPPPRFVLPGFQPRDRERLVDTFTIVRLWEIPQERVLNTDAYALWPLSALMAGTSVETTALVAERILDAPVPIEERRELTGLLLTLAGLRLPTDELLAAARRNPMIDELLRESGVSQEFIREGMERGREEGMERGRTQGVRSAVRLLLEGRFGALDEALAAAIEQADEAMLEQVLLHATKDTLEQLRARLGLG